MGAQVTRVAIRLQTAAPSTAIWMGFETRFQSTRTSGSLPSMMARKKRSAIEAPNGRGPLISTLGEGEGVGVGEGEGAGEGEGEGAGEGVGGPASLPARRGR